MDPDVSRFGVFILTHGRPDNVLTFDTLRKAGYTGPVYLIIDNEDSRGQEYRDRFGPENVIEFDKAAVAETFDTADTQNDRRAIVYARNASFEIAKNLGLDYFLQLDDDYTDFLYRYVEGSSIRSVAIRSMDAVVEAMLTFLDETGAATVAFSQGGDHMGGVEGWIDRGLLRKAMNSFFCRTSRPIRFVGRVNEDVNTYVVRGGRGELFLTVMGLQLNQVATQQSAGGMTGIYKDAGTYVKSFYTVMMAPSATSVRSLGRNDHRCHHSVRGDLAYPKILSSRYRKPR